MTKAMPSKPPYNSAKLQCASILLRLEKSPATVEQLRAECNAIDPRARVRDLRKKGHTIDTLNVDQVSPDNHLNEVGLYVLRVKDDRQSELELEEK